MCVYSVWENDHEYIRNHKLDLDKIRAYESKTAYYKSYILLINEKETKNLLSFLTILK